MRTGQNLTWKMMRNLTHSGKIHRFPEVDINYKSIYEESLQKATALHESAGTRDFEEFIKEDVDPISPLGITFEDWYNNAKTIDGISDEDAVDISKTATPYLNENLKEKDK